MSSYPGNGSLTAIVKERVISTFQQSVALYRQGRTEEAVAGCGLVLQMDPMFDPAKRLLDKARNPASPIDVDELAALVEPASSGAMGQLAEAREAMAARDFQRVINITTDVLTNDLMNDEARILGDEAREKMEAAPFITQFLKKAEQQAAAGNRDAALATLEKARALDADHPAIAATARLLTQTSAPAAPAPAQNPVSSFVVEAPAAAARGAAQAADFGFTFEEDKQPEPAPKAESGGFHTFSFDDASSGPFAGGFSFDTAAPSAPPEFSFDAPGTAAPPASGEFDFSTASVETSADDQKKIEQYLQEGDRAFESADYQRAIDLWSRIFLIDVTNDAASDRIERAKLKRREIEQNLDTVLAGGIEAYERRDLVTARERFNEVLRADPSNVTAHDYLEKLGAGTMPSAAPPPFIPPPSVENDILSDDSMSGSFETPLIPPDAPAAAAPRRGTSRPSAVKPKPRFPAALLAGVAALLILLAGGWFAWSRFFAEPAIDPAATRAAIEHATALGQQGKFDRAISMLQDVKPGDPLHDRALSLIDELQRKKARASELIDGRPPVVYYQENLADARTAFDNHDYVGAKAAFERALRVKPLPPDMKAAYDVAAQQVKKLDTARALFAERKYTDVIAALEPLLQQDPENKNIRRMIVDAHFNLGAAALQEERLPDAVREFEQVLQSDPDDQLARRSRDLAVRYDGQPKDLLYRIYVKYLPLRQPAA